MALSHLDKRFKNAVNNVSHNSLKMAMAAIYDISLKENLTSELIVQLLEHIEGKKK